MRSPPTLPTLLFSLLSLLAGAAAAQTRQPLPDVPPPPPEMQPLDAALEPQVTIKKRDGETVQEYRMKGRLYMVKVTPAHGRPYFLIDDRGDGNLVRRDTLDEGVRPPMWVIKEF